MNFRVIIRFSMLIGIVFGLGSPLFSQTSKVEQAFRIIPRQKGVDYDQPTSAEQKKCKLKTSKNPPGFIVVDETGRVLRQFFDRNKDKHLDQWSYFKNGIEVYRDVDENFDRKTDTYRWVGGGGAKWGIDKDQDGVIDSWKFISAEEVAFEAFEAIRNQDASRFQRVLLSDQELASLQLGESIESEARKRLENARKNFLSFAKGQKQIGPSTEWIHAGNGRPSMSPRGAHGNQKDIVVYSHGAAVFKSREYGQLALGSIVRTGSGWRLMELPEVVEEGKPISNGGIFFPLPEMNEGPVITKPDDRLAKLYQKLDEIETALKSTKKESEIAQLEERKAKTLEQLFLSSKDKEQQENWLENLADTVSSAYQSERFPQGLDYLQGFSERLKKANHNEGRDYIAWRIIYAKYGLAMDIGDRKEREKAQKQLIADLKDFQKEFPSSPHAADAICQIASNYEIEGEMDDAIKWYKEAVRRFPRTSFGKRGAGAIVRLESKGKRIPFVGHTLSGKKFSLQDPRLRGKVVVIHYWETWCTDGLEEIQRLVEKYDDNVVFVGCNIDKETKAFTDYLADHRDFAAWTQLHAPGSIEESPLAHQLGVSSEPLVLIFGKKGELIESDIAFGDLDREIQRLLRKK